MATNIQKFLIAFTSLAFLILMDYFFKDDLFNESLIFIAKIQEINHTSGFMLALLYDYNYIAMVSTVLIPILIFYIIPE